LIDTSVQKYLDQVNTILDTQLTHLECVAIGTGQVLGADLKSSLPFASPPEPVETLEEDTEKMINGFSVDDAPVMYSQRYSDLLYRGATTSCQVSISPQASVEVSAIIENVRPRWTVWYRLNGKCANAKACYSQVLTETSTAVSRADERDVEAVSAHTRLMHIASPSFPYRFLGKWDPTFVENTMKELLSIQDGISAAKLAREAVANAYAEDAEKLVAAAEKNLSGAQANQGSSDLGQLTNAVSLAAAATSNSDKVKDDLAKAAALDATLSQRLKTIADRFGTVASAAPAAAQAANTKADQIRAALGAAAQRAAAQAVNRSFGIGVGPRNLPH